MEGQLLRNPEEISYWKEIFAAIFTLTIVAAFVLGWGNPSSAPPGGAGTIIFKNGNVGIGISDPQTKLAVGGNVSIGANYAGSIAPPNSLIVEGNVGVGTANPGSMLSVAGAAAIGTTYQGISAPADSLIVEGNISIGRTDPGLPIAARLDIASGGFRIGGTAQIGRWQSRVSLTNSNNFPDYFVASCPSPSLPCSDGTDFGKYSSLTMGVDGLPVIAYYDADEKDLKFIYCDTNNCKSGFRKIIDSGGNVGEYVSLAIGADGFPIMAYYDATPGTGNLLKVAKCLDVSCVSPPTISVPFAANGGKYTSITIQTEGSNKGFPLIASSLEGTNNVRLTFCSSANCGIVGSYADFSIATTFGSISLAIADDGFPIVAIGPGVTAPGRSYVIKCNYIDCQ